MSSDYYCSSNAELDRNFQIVIAFLHRKSGKQVAKEFSLPDITVAYNIFRYTMYYQVTPNVFPFRRRFASLTCFRQDAEFWIKAVESLRARNTAAPFVAVEAPTTKPSIFRRILQFIKQK